MFLNIGGLALALYSAVQARRAGTSEGGPADTVRNTVTDAEVSGPALLGRDIRRVSVTGTPLSAPTNADSPDGPVPAAERGSADVLNRVEGGTFRGPLIMGRDMSDVVLSPPPSSDKQGRDGTGR